jgi:ABC-2 type transport system permease protein
MNQLIRTHLIEAKYELVKLLRMPGYVLPTFAFPVAFYLFFGVIFNHGRSGSKEVAAYLLATYGAFGVIGASLFGFGINIATERGQGWLQLKRTTPMPMSSYFVAKIAMAMLFSATIVLLLFSVGAAFGGVRFAMPIWPQLFAMLVFGALPFCAFGLAIGYFAGPNSAAGIVNVIYIPISFLSGLWIPVTLLPAPIRGIAHYLPPYHLAQLALGTFGAGEGSAVKHVIALLSYAALFLMIASIGYDRDEGKLYG